MNGCDKKAGKPTMRVANSGPHSGNLVATVFAKPMATPACTPTALLKLIIRILLRPCSQQAVCLTAELWQQFSDRT